jgi:hypothetical protein
LHNSSEHDTDSALPTEASKSTPIVRRECFAVPTISIDAEAVAGRAASSWSARWTSSDRQETPQLPAADDIRDTDRIMKLAKLRFIGVQELCLVENILAPIQHGTRINAR